MTNDTKHASEKISILDLLDDTHYRTYHVNVARYLKSVNAAIMLAELIGRYKYHISRNELTEDGWFYHTHEAIEQRTVLSRREQDSALNILMSFGMIDKKLIGLPAKRHFKINELEILEMIGNDINNSSLYKNAKLGCTTKNMDVLYKQDCTKTPNCIGGKRQTAHNIEEPKEEPKKITKDCATGVALSAGADDLLSFFIQKLKERKPDIKLPDNLKKWLQEIDRMIRIDKRDPKKIKAMIQWIHKDPFWSSNILSPKKLREQYDQIELQALRKHSEKMHHENQDYVNRMKSKYHETYKNLVMTNLFVRNSSSGKEISLKLPPETFKKEFIRIFGGNYDDLPESDK